MISPIFEALSDKVTEIDYYKVDVDASPDISQEVNIRAVRFSCHLFDLFFVGRLKMTDAKCRLDAQLYCFQKW
jgi:hypothetical protein